MSEKPVPGQRRLLIDGASMPKLARHARLRFDNTRKCWILLAPERILMPNDIAVAVLQLCDGAGSVDAIAATLARDYDAPLDEIGADILPVLQDLADKGYLDA